MKRFFRLVIVVVAVLAGACTDPDSTQLTNIMAGKAQTDAATQTQYTCPMHPHYLHDDGDGTCPICGMGLVPVASDDTHDESAHATLANTSIVVADGMLQSMGVRTAPVAHVDFGQTLRAFGVVETNERLESVAVSRLEGWIENLTARAEGDTVRPGALLYRVYSPDLIAAQKDYLNSLSIGNENRIAATRQRLRSLGMQQTTIDRLTKTQQAVDRVPVYAEAGGTVSALTVREGDYVQPGTPILRLQSYAGVWVMASVPDSDLPLIDTGLPVALNFPSAPAAPSEGRIDYIYPTIDPRTRTARVRIEIDNTDGHLRPGAYADVTMDLGGEARLSVPSEAVLRDSRGAHVIVALGGGRFAARTVRTGISATGWTEILAGLTAGENVVSSGQFMLDSEVNLREGLSKLEGAQIDPDAGAIDPHAHHR